MYQVSEDIYWGCSSDYIFRFNSSVNMWKYTKQLNPIAKFYGGSIAGWFDID